MNGDARACGDDAELHPGSSPSGSLRVPLSRPLREIRDLSSRFGIGVLDLSPFFGVAAPQAGVVAALRPECATMSSWGRDGSGPDASRWHGSHRSCWLALVLPGSPSDGTLVTSPTAVLDESPVGVLGHRADETYGDTPLGLGDEVLAVEGRAVDGAIRGGEAPAVGPGDRLRYQVLRPGEGLDRELDVEVPLTAHRSGRRQSDSPTGSSWRCPCSWRDRCWCGEARAPGRPWAPWLPVLRPASA